MRCMLILQRILIHNSVLKARPDFSTIMNFGFGLFGFQLAFDFNYDYYRRQSFSDSRRVYIDSGFMYLYTYEIFSFNPYFYWGKSNFSISVGPLIGGLFSQSKSQSSYSNTSGIINSNDKQSSFIYGASIELHYILGKHCFAYFSLPFFFEAGYNYSTNTSYSITEYQKFGSAVIQFLPKVGVMYMVSSKTSN